MIWNARPRHEPNWVSESSWVGDALAHMAPSLSDAVRSAAVLAEWMNRRVSGEMGFPSFSRSRTCPAMRCFDPDAAASSRMRRAVG